MNRREFFLASVVGIAMRDLRLPRPTFRTDTDRWDELGIQNPQYPVGHVRRYGAAGDGKTDDTDAFASAIREIRIAGGGDIIADRGTYLINADLGAGKGIRLPSNCTLRLSSDATLQAKPNALPNSAVIWLKDVTNAHVVGGTILGERNEHTGTTGEWGMGILMDSAHNCSVKATTVANCWGDGIYIGSIKAVADTESTDILLDGVTCDNNRRQGVSIVSARRVRIQDSHFSRTHGTRPAAGIDFEPDKGTAVIADCVVTGCSFDDNEMGILLAGPCVRIGVVKNSFSGNRLIGVYLTGKVEEARIEDNVIAQASEASTGIVLRDVVGAKVTNNTIKGVFEKDISELGRASGNQMVGNHTIKG